MTLLVLVHVPKTAGTTLGTLLQHHYGERFRRIDMSGVHVGADGALYRHGEGAEPQRLPVLVDARGLDAVAGHVPFGLRHLLPGDARYVTILRDPVERTLSQYYHLVARTAAWRHESLPAPPADLRLVDAIGTHRYIQDNLQTRMLCGLASIDDPLPSDALEQAKRNLRECFAYVGTTERFDELLALLNVELDWPTVAYERSRVSATRPRGDDVPADARRAAEAASALDRELHAFAGELLDDALARAGSAVQAELDVLRRAAAGRSTPLRALPPEARVELAAKEAELLRAREELRAQERRYAKRTQQWRELKRQLKAASEAVPGARAVGRLAGRARRYLG